MRHRGELDYIPESANPAMKESCVPHPTADKNFRLPETVRPERYQPHLSIDLRERRFRGRQTVQLRLARPTDEIILHAVELQLSRATATTGGRSIDATAIEPVPASQTVILGFPQPLPAGTAALEVEWAGAFSPGLRGLYAAGPMAVTQFEAADARRVFPCFDEPAFKARWALSVDVPQGVNVLANGAALRDEVREGRRNVEFDETPPISSYLVALAVGPMVSSQPIDVRGVPLRTWAVPEKERLTGFAQEAGAAVLPLLEDYFGLPYAFKKVDQVGVPDFEAGAMENVGLITFRETVLLLDPGTASLDVKKRVAEVITHELAHQWFGNWVTMQWWDDLWLNEAFATWMAYKMVDVWKPEWRLWLDFDVGTASAMHLDALRSTHPIRSEVKNADEATESFDVITYEKGGAVLRMIEGFLGAEKFREGIRLYMRRFGQKNAVADDLWAALGEASKQPVVELANAWIRQEGFPLVSVSRKGATLSLSQRRFFSEPGVTGEGTWPVPMVLRFADSQGVKTQRFLLQTTTAEVALEHLDGEVRWLVANADQTGFYRVAYDSRLLEELGSALRELTPSERVALLADTWALVRAGVKSIGDFLSLVDKYQGETDYAVLNELVGRLWAIEHRLLDDGDRPAFAAFIEGVFGDQLDRLGWGSTADRDEVKLQRAALLRAVGGIARRPALSKESAARLGRFWSGDKDALEANLHAIALGIAARDGDQALFDALLSRAATEQDPSFKRRYLMALTAFEDWALSARAIGLALTDKVPAQEFAGFVHGLLANRAAREKAWEMLQQSWDGVLTKTGGAPMILRRVIEGLGLLPERRQFESVREFLNAHPVDAVKQGIRQTLERMDQDTILRERVKPQLGEWLKRR